MRQPFTLCAALACSGGPVLLMADQADAEVVRFTATYDFEAYSISLDELIGPFSGTIEFDFDTDLVSTADARGIVNGIPLTSFTISPQPVASEALDTSNLFAQLTIEDEGVPDVSRVLISGQTSPENRFSLRYDFPTTAFSALDGPLALDRFKPSVTIDNNTYSDSADPLTRLEGTLSAVIVPEPGSLALMWIGGLALLRRRR